MILVILFSVIFILLCLHIFFAIKYNNPHKYFFLFGKKGSGKTCFMTSEMIKYINKGWVCYTDASVNIPLVRHIDNANELFKIYTPEPHSCIFLDEIGTYWHARDFKKFDSRIREWFKYQRKYKVRVYANSQVWDIDKSLRDLNDRLYLVDNIGNYLSVLKPIFRKFTVATNSDGESKITDALEIGSLFKWKFYFMPKYFKYFTSFDAPERPLMPYRLNDCDYSYKELRKMGFSKKCANAILSSYEKG